ncbi:hypothetical protein SporoP17a_07010 [Sporosarcina ureae]|nr:hypothetical protein SporoP17a_07010 [Sporosarcina ureae]
MCLETKEETEKRFYVKSTDDLLSLGRITVLVDRNTAVNYLHAWLEPSEQRRVRLAVFLCTLQKLRHLSKVSRRTLIPQESAFLRFGTLCYSKKIYKNIY